MKRIISFLLLAFFGIVFSNCKSDEKKSSALKSLEQMIKNETGEHVELPDNYSMENSSAKVNYTFDGKPFFDAKETFTSGVVVKSVNGFLEIYLQLSSEDGKTLMVSSQKIPQDFKLPLKIPFLSHSHNSDEDMIATMSAVDLSNPEFSYGFGVPYEGEIIIIKMQNRLVAFEVNAKGGDYRVAQNPDSWKPIKAKIELINPIIQTMGIEKSKIFK